MTGLVLLVLVLILAVVAVLLAERSAQQAKTIRFQRSAIDRQRGRIDGLVAHSIDTEHLRRQMVWSRATFGPGRRTAGVLDHIRKELREVEENPTDVREWIDIVILALDGAWRAGSQPEQIIDAIKSKQATNEARTWPDWRTLSENVAIEHVRESS